MFKIATGLAVIGGAMMMAAPSFAADATVDLTAANTFTPAAVTISTGEKVTFKWVGGFHDVTFADGVSSGAPGGVAGTTYSRTFTTAGTFSYVCTVHESTGMKGTVTVQAGAAAPAPAAPAPAAPAPAAPAPAAPAPAAPAPAAPAPGAAPAAPAPAAAPAPGAATSPAVSPMTGPEESILPIAGLALVLGGLGLRFRLRRAS